MKIGLVCPYHMFKGGGVQECVLALQAELTRVGHEAIIITPRPRDYSGSVPPEVITIGVSATVSSFFNTQTQVSATADREAIENLLDKEQFDVLHFHEPWVPVLSRQLLSRSRCANVATSHARLPDRLTSKTVANVFIPYTRRLLKFIDVYSAVSEPAAEYIKGFIKDPISIIPNGIDLAKYTQSTHSAGDSPMILYVGRLEKRKGIKYLLDAFSILGEHDKKTRLFIAGTGPEEESLKNYVNEKNIHRVEFLGYVDETRKIELFRQARLFCAPSKYGESFGIVLLEAMAVGLPVVAGDNPGYETVLKDRGMVSLVNVQDSVDFARRMRLLLSDDALRELWRTWAQTYVQQFDYKNVTQQYIELYETAIKIHKAKSA